MTVMTHQLINLDYLNSMTDGDAEMKQEMLGMLTAEIPEEIGKLQDAAAAEDWEEVFQISHKLKTTLAFVGNEDMTTLNKTIEHCARHTVDTAELPPMVAQLTAMSLLVVEELQSIIE